MDEQAGGTGGRKLAGPAGPWPGWESGHLMHRPGFGLPDSFGYSLSRFGAKPLWAMDCERSSLCRVQGGAKLRPRD